MYFKSQLLKKSQLQHDGLAVGCESKNRNEGDLKIFGLIIGRVGMTLTGREEQV